MHSPETEYLSIKTKNVANRLHWLTGISVDLQVEGWTRNLEAAGFKRDVPTVWALVSS